MISLTFSRALLYLEASKISSNFFFKTLPSLRGLDGGKEEGRGGEGRGGEGRGGEERGGEGRGRKGREREGRGGKGTRERKGGEFFAIVEKSRND